VDEDARILYEVQRDSRSALPPDDTLVRKFARDCNDKDIVVRELERRQMILKAVRELNARRDA
jgi:hypothetical protein